MILKISTKSELIRTGLILLEGGIVSNESNEKCGKWTGAIDYLLQDSIYKEQINNGKPLISAEKIVINGIIFEDVRIYINDTLSYSGDTSKFLN